MGQSAEFGQFLRAVLPPFAADISASLRALGVREHVLQQVHTEGVRPKLAARLATLGLGSVT